MSLFVSSEAYSVDSDVSCDDDDDDDDYDDDDLINRSRWST